MSDEQQARRRQRRFCKKWEQEQALAVAKVRQDFEDTLTCYHIPAAAALPGQKWPARHLRTISPLERELRPFRRRLSGAVLFHSTVGLMAVVHQLLIRRATARPGSWQTVLEHALVEVDSFSEGKIHYRAHGDYAGGHRLR